MDGAEFTRTYIDPACAEMDGAPSAEGVQGSPSKGLVDHLGIEGLDSAQFALARLKNKGLGFISPCGQWGW